MKPVTTPAVLAAIQEHTGVTFSDMCTKDRPFEFVFARAVFSHVMHEHGNLSYPEIAHVFGRKSHTPYLDAKRRLAEGAYDSRCMSRFGWFRKGLVERVLDTAQDRFWGAQCGAMVERRSLSKSGGSA